MSAFEVSARHLSAVVAVFLYGARDSVSWTKPDPTLNAIDRLVRMLADENTASVAYLYRQEADPRPEPEIMQIAYEAATTRRDDLPSTIEAAKLLACLEYQSCERDEWETTPAYRWINRLRADLLMNAPGYYAADWHRN